MSSVFPSLPQAFNLSIIKEMGITEVFLKLSNILINYFYLHEVFSEILTTI